MDNVEFKERPFQLQRALVGGNCGGHLGRLNVFAYWIGNGGNPAVIRDYLESPVYVLDGAARAQVRAMHAGAYSSTGVFRNARYWDEHLRAYVALF